MTLTVDVGNTNIAFGVWQDGNWVAHWRLRTDIGKTADEYRVLFRSLLEDDGLRLGSFDSVVVSSVVPALTPAIAAVTERIAERKPLIVRHDLVTGLNPESPIPPELGSDLLANAVAAWDRFHDAAIVVDFGTALTFTAVSHDARILGVAIAPGLLSAVGALSTNTAQLPAVELQPPPQALARTTEHSIQAGIVYGYVGLVNEVVRRMASEMETAPTVVATGGLAETIAPVMDRFDVVDQWLTLDGLRRLGELNREGTRG